MSKSSIFASYIKKTAKARLFPTFDQVEEAAEEGKKKKRDREDDKDSEKTKWTDYIVPGAVGLTAAGTLVANPFGSTHDLSEAQQLGLSKENIGSAVLDLAKKDNRSSTYKKTLKDFFKRKGLTPEQIENKRKYFRNVLDERDGYIAAVRKELAINPHPGLARLDKDTLNSHLTHAVMKRGPNTSGYSKNTGRDQVKLLAEGSQTPTDFLLRGALTGGGGLGGMALGKGLGNLILGKQEEDESKKKKLLRMLIQAAGGAGGVYLGHRLGPRSRIVEHMANNPSYINPLEESSRKTTAGLMNNKNRLKLVGHLL